MAIRGGGLDRKSTAASEIPSSSLADIAFLLRIFFMVTTVFRTDKERPIEWAEAEATKKIDEKVKNILNIWVNAAGEILLGEEIVSLQQVEREVRRRVAENPLLIVSLKSDRETDYDIFVQILDQLQKAETPKISLADPD